MDAKIKPDWRWMFVFAVGVLLMWWHPQEHWKGVAASFALAVATTVLLILRPLEATQGGQSLDCSRAVSD
jgi:membrane protein YdbS with pleckstrin-like domain